MANESEFHRGTVKVYSAIKEYGFITREKGKDLFFLRSSFDDEQQISEGAVVEFSIEHDEKGRGDRASNIKRIS
jgi:CspA family cold shock protein